MGTQFNTPTSRIPRSGYIPVWDGKLGQWVPVKAPLVYSNGAVNTTPVTYSQAQVFTSTGAFGPYSITFPTAFTVAPTVTATTGLAGGNFSIIDITAVTTTSFTFSLAMFTPGLVVIPNLTTVLIEWIAVGS